MEDHQIRHVVGGLGFLDKIVRNPSARDFYGPVTSKSSKGEEVMTGVGFCEVSEISQSLACRMNPWHVAMISWSVICTVLLGFLICLNYAKLHLKLAKLGAPLTWRHFKLVNEEERVTYSLSKVILICLLGPNLAKACVLPTSHEVSNEEHVYQFNLLEGQSICAGEVFTSNHLLNEVVYTYMYDTYDWEITTEENWGCGGGSCPDSSDCGYIHTDDKGNRITYCEEYLRGCAFSRGCYVGERTIIKLGKAYKVNKIQGLTGKTLINTFEDCKMYSSVVSNFELSGFLVYGEEGSYICPQSSSTGEPTLGLLGDLQEIKSKLRFPWTSLTCGRSWYGNRKCSYEDPFVRKLSDRCQKLPFLSAYGMMSILDKSLLLSGDQTNLIYLTCPNNKTFLSSQTSCSKPDIKLWGVRNSQQGLKMTVRANSQSEGVSTEIENPCGAGFLFFPCDGKDHVFPVSGEGGCIGVDDKTISLDMFRVSKEGVDMKWLFHGDKVAPVIHFGGSMVSVLLLILLLIALCSKGR